MRVRISLVLALSSTTLLASCASPVETPADSAGVVQQYSIEEFYQNTAYNGASFSSNGRRLLVNSNQTGVFNVWAIPIDGGPPTALTTSTTDPMFSRGYFPADDRILVLAATGWKRAARTSTCGIPTVRSATSRRAQR